MIESGEYEECDDNNVDYSEMYQQTSRLATYLLMYNHVFTDFSPIKLAKKGLFYNERYNVIICFSCRKKTPTKFQIVFSGPSYNKTNFHFEECKLENNKPISVPDADIYELIRFHLHREYCVETNPPATINKFITPQSNTTPIDPQTASSQKHQKPSSQNQTDYDSVDKRFATFSNWPSSNPVEPLELAKAGFIYLGSGDTVQCVYCQGKLSQWEPGDNPVQEHFRHFSSCFFILEMKMNNTTPLTGTARVAESTDSCTDQPHVNTNISSNPNATKSPTGGKYTTIISRLKTLNNWAHPTATAYQLSLAGFYWDEMTKSCKCFLCNVNIANWQEGDDPFKVHALKSPDCSYILQVKGKKFVNDTVTHSFMVDRETDCAGEDKRLNIEETDTLKDENEKLKDEKMCIICMTQPKTFLILPCAHFVCCSMCISSLKNCPVCRTQIKGTVKIFQT